jgi:hypothetical protein
MECRLQKSDLLEYWQAVARIRLKSLLDGAMNQRIVAENPGGPLSAQFRFMSSVFGRRTEASSQRRRRDFPTALPIATAPAR